MKESRMSNGVEAKSWFEKISQALTGEPKNREQLVELLRDSEQRNLLEADSLAMIEGVMQVSEMHVRDIMIPRSQMEIVNRDASPEEILPAVVKSGHSRFPVIGENRDEVDGILLAKDLLSYFAAGEGAKFEIRDMMRTPIFIPESKRLNILLTEFRSNRNHMAIVVDEYGGVAGLVTIEDVLEQIVGEIEDEYDIDEDTFIKKYSNEHYSIKALTPIEEFNDYFKASLNEDEFDTIGGLIMKAFGHLPERNEKTSIDGFQFTVMRADKRRIHLLKMTLDDTSYSNLSQNINPKREH